MQYQNSKQHSPYIELSNAVKEKDQNKITTQEKVNNNSSNPNYVPWSLVIGQSQSNRIPPGNTMKSNTTHKKPIPTPRFTSISTPMKSELSSKNISTMSTMPEGNQYNYLTIPQVITLNTPATSCIPIESYQQLPNGNNKSKINKSFEKEMRLKPNKPEKTLSITSRPTNSSKIPIVSKSPSTNNIITKEVISNKNSPNKPLPNLPPKNISHLKKYSDVNNQYEEVLEHTQSTKKPLKHSFSTGSGQKSFETQSNFSWHCFLCCVCHIETQNKTTRKSRDTHNVVDNPPTLLDRLKISCIRIDDQNVRK